ncbi:kinase-like domain-containing protein [Mycena vitilis]|nr:kinase-like domain-containing protein [Mycena vitilis]
MARSEDAYVFAAMEELYEEPNSHGPGGFSPVRLGDVLASRYRIVTKLGHGSYSTVWLARDLIGERTVALKIVEAKTSEGSNEAAILERLLAPPGVDPVKSPNGVHQVLVTEMVMSLQNYVGLASGAKNSRNLHPMNIGIALPELDTLSDIEIWDIFGPPIVEPIVAYDSTRDPASFPPYLSAPINLNSFVMDETLDLKFAMRGPPRVRIIDLGCAYSVESSPPPQCNTPLGFMPPEVIFQRVVDRKNAGYWDRRSDVWSLACLLHTLVSARSLFTRSCFGPQLDDSFIRMMANACGSVPEAWTNHLSVPATEFTLVESDAGGRRQGSQIRLWRTYLAIFASCGACSSSIRQSDPPQRSCCGIRILIVSMIRTFVLSLIL